MQKSIKIIVIAINHGSGHVFTTDVDATGDEYVDGQHFAIAVARAAEAGFVAPLLAVETDDLVRLVMQISTAITQRNAAH
jgi:hypothetical protein